MLLTSKHRYRLKGIGQEFSGMLQHRQPRHMVVQDACFLTIFSTSGSSKNRNSTNVIKCLESRVTGKVSKKINISHVWFCENMPPRCWKKHTTGNRRPGQWDSALSRLHHSAWWEKLGQHTVDGRNPANQLIWYVYIYIYHIYIYHIYIYVSYIPFFTGFYTSQVVPSTVYRYSYLNFCSGAKSSPRYGQICVRFSHLPAVMMHPTGGRPGIITHPKQWTIKGKALQFYHRFA